MERILLVVLAAGCASERTVPSGADADVDLRTSCDPQMGVFPVDGPHNIGYDAASCGTGTCEISCPDENANSDWGGSHHGIDVFAWHRAPLVAVTDGEIVAVGTPSATSGLRVRLRDACGWEYYYGHLDEAAVSVGQQVSAGQLVGYMGETGTASTHLHFNISPDGAYSSDIDPFGYLAWTSGTACDGSVPAGEPDPVPEPEAPGDCGGLWANQGLPSGGVVSSCDGRFTLAMQEDGNLVLTQTGVRVLWSTGTHGHPGSVVWQQGDGNLVVYGANGAPLWSSGTQGHPEGTVLAVQDDGNLVIYTGAGAIWSSGTCCH